MKIHEKSFSLPLLIFTVILKSHDAVTVKPCPTNKVAPYRRASLSPVRQRTFGSVFELFHDEGSPSYAGGQLQDDPQEEEPADDCGDIEDYDETDLSSVTHTQRLQDYKNNRFFFGNFFNRPSIAPPIRPDPPTPHTRPPVGGYFGTNSYRPPPLHDPSDNLKPVHEQGFEQQAPYRPGVVGGPSGHVVGVPPRPNRVPPLTTQPSLQSTNNNPPQRYRPGYTTRRPRMHRYSNSVVGSFFDLLF